MRDLGLPATGETKALTQRSRNLVMFSISPVTASISSAVVFGIADFLGGRVALRLGAPLAVALVQTVAWLFVLLVVVIGRYPIPDGRDFYLSLLAGLADGSALILLYRGLAVGRISVVAPLTGVCSIALPAVFENSFLVHFGTQIVAGIVLAAIAVILISHASSADNQDRPLSTSVILGLSSGATFGVTNLFLGLLAPENANGGILIMRAGAVATAVFVVLLQQSTVRRDQQGFRLAAVTGVLDGIGMTGLVYSATVGLIGVAASINSLYAGVTVLLGVLVLKERLAFTQIAGLLVGAASILLLADTH